MNTQGVASASELYISAVAAELNGIEPGSKHEVIEELAAHVAALADDGVDDPQTVLGDPGEYARELLASAGIAIEHARATSRLVAVWRRQHVVTRVVLALASLGIIAWTAVAGAILVHNATVTTDYPPSVVKGDVYLSAPNLVGMAGEDALELLNQMGIGACGSWPIPVVTDQFPVGVVVAQGTPMGEVINPAVQCIEVSVAVAPSASSVPTASPTPLL